MLGWFKVLSFGKKVAVVFASLLVAGSVNAAVNPSSSTPTTQAPKVQSQPKPSPHRVQALQTKTVTETQVIPFESTTQQDATLASGKSIVAVAGVNGLKTITYNVTLDNGIEASREKVSEEITTQPITQVTKIGTYVAPVSQPTCPNGTYVNTYGNTVCSPYSASSVPTGATAKCYDGTYSFSQTHSGTCSHHGGVSEWL